MFKNIFDAALKKRTKEMFQNAISEIREKYTQKKDMPKATELILNSLDKGEWNGTEVPIVDIAKYMGFICYTAKLERNCSGFIAIDNKGEFKERFGSNKIIFVNRVDNIGHKRFTIAHEIAHYILDFDEKNQIEYYDYYTTDERTDLSEEKRANFFAANLLMPEKSFKEIYKENRKNYSLAETQEILRDEFKVSLSAVEKRMHELNLA